VVFLSTRAAPPGRGLNLQATIAEKFVGLLVTDAEAGASGEHAGGNVHGEEFLEEQLGGVGDVDLGDTRLVVARAALVFALLQLTTKLSVTSTKLNTSRYTYAIGLMRPQMSQT
jgi:hypothetical protein